MSGALSSYTDNPDVYLGEDSDYDYTDSPLIVGAATNEMVTPPQGGALTGQSLDTTQKLDALDAASARLQAAREARNNGGVNMAMLAAAGALLSPTRSGGFGESLGNAMTAAVPVAQKQQAMDEQRSLQAAQMDWNNALRKAQLANQERARDQADVREANRVQFETDREKRLMAHQRQMAELATSRNDMGKYEYREAEIPDPDDPTKKIPGYMKFDKTGREPPEPVAMGVVGAKNGRQNKETTNDILTKNSLTQAEADIQKRETNGETLTDADKARIRNQYIAKGKLDTSPFMQSMNATQSAALRQIIANDPAIADDTEALGRAVKQIKGGQTLGADALANIDSRARMVSNSLDALTRMKKILDDTVGTAGVAGKVFRPGEAVTNVLGFSDDTSRADFQSKLSFVRNALPTLLTYKGSGNHSKEANEQIAKILRGDNIGDTLENTKSSIDSLMKVFVNDIKGLRGEYNTSTGNDLPIFRKNTSSVKPENTPQQKQTLPPSPAAPSMSNTAPQLPSKEGSFVKQNGVLYKKQADGTWEAVK